MGYIAIRPLCLRHGQGHACDMAPCAHDTAGPGHDTTGLRPATQPGGPSCNTALGAPRHGHAHVPGHACAHLGVMLGQQAVHLVHPACF